MDVYDPGVEEDNSEADQVCTLNPEGTDVNLGYKMNAVGHWKSEISLTVV